MAEKSLATVGAPATSLPSPAEWANIFDMAEKLVPTGFLPESIKTPAQAAAVMLKGRELGIPPMYALSNIAVIKGKPTCGAELMLALIYRDHGDNGLLGASRCHGHPPLDLHPRIVTDHTECHLPGGGGRELHH